MRMTEAQITQLLAERHARRGDIFVSQCKTGPSWFDENTSNKSAPTCRRLDAWAMKRSWVNPCMTAYEVKTSKADLHGDGKWKEYLKYCNKFFFVVTDSMVSHEEIPAFKKRFPCAGLIKVSKDGKSLRVIVQPTPEFRNVKPPVNLFKYLFFWRAEIR